MDNPETLATSGTQYTEKRHKKQTNKQTSKKATKKSFITALCIRGKVTLFINSDPFTFAIASSFLLWYEKHSADSSISWRGWVSKQDLKNKRNIFITGFTNGTH